MTETLAKMMTCAPICRQSVERCEHFDNYRAYFRTVITRTITRNTNHYTNHHTNHQTFVVILLPVIVRLYTGHY